MTVTKTRCTARTARMYAIGESQKRGPFVLGTQNFKLESIKEHEKSQGHLTSGESSMLFEPCPELENAKTLSDSTCDSKKGRPFTDFVWMCELDEMKGLQLVRRREIAYRHSSQMQSLSQFFLMAPQIVQ